MNSVVDGVTPPANPSRKGDEPLRVMVVAGEVSGDQRAASVLAAMKRYSPEASFRGMGGSHLRSVGVDLVVDAEQIGAVMGISEVASSLRTLAQAEKALVRLMETWNPHLLLLVDFPTFNLRLAKAAAARELPVYYHVAPKVWASRPGRVAALRERVSEVSVIFPFEKQFLESQGMHRVSYVGHPFATELPRPSETERAQVRAQVRSQLGLMADEKLVVVFPGSRQKEIEHHLAPMLEGVALLRKEGVAAHAVLALPPHLARLCYDEVRTRAPWCHLWHGEHTELMVAGDCGVLKSGTCNLEAAFLGLPFAMVYRVSPVSARVITSVSSLKEYSIVNVLRPGTVTELLQKECEPGLIRDELQKLLLDAARISDQKRSFAEIRRELSGADPCPGVREQPTATADRVALRAQEVAEQRVLPSSSRVRLLSFLSSHKGRFGVALVCMVVYGATDGLVPFFVKFALDHVLDPSNASYLTIFPLALIGLTLIRALADFGQQFFMNSVGHLVVRDIRTSLHNHLLRMTPGFFQRRSSGDLIARATADVQLVRALLTDSVAALLRDSVRIVALVAAALYMDPILALLAVVVFPIGVLPVASFGRRMRKLTKRGQEAIGTLSGLLSETILGNKVVKIFCGERFEQSRFGGENEQITRTLIKSEKARALIGPVNELLASVAVAAILYYGGTTVLAGTRTKGEFLAFLAAVFLMYDPFKKLSRVSGAVQQGLAGAQRIFEILDAPTEITDPAEASEFPPHHHIELERVSFRYKEKDSYALSDISLSIPQGSHVALVGFSGSGKSTMVDLLPRFIEPESGVIRIGGVDIKKLSLRDLRTNLAMVSQHTFLFDDSILNNIRYGRQDATLDEVEEAARRARAYDFIMRLPQGFQTRIGEGGFTLSGGERQRIAIARAIISNAPILILDEATAALDNKAERQVQQALEELSRERTTVTIAHRLSTIRSADLIVVMRDGRIIETGTHEELLSSEGEYQHLHRYQFAEIPEPHLAQGERATEAKMTSECHVSV